jgi:RNA polymerase sigma-70 factor (ECF subfamily)
MYEASTGGFVGGQSIAASIDRPTTDLTVARARSGDLGAFEELYRRHVDRVYGLCLRMTADPSRAEDHAQETFVRAWQKLDSYRGEAGFITWLTRIAINVVRGEWRSRGRHDERERPLDGTEAPIPSPGGTTLDLERAIAGLPGGAREVFVLHDVEGYRHDEVADLLDVTPGTSKSQLHRARKLLREALSR